ncbi:OsmC family protein [Nocardioides solisilvae]|uniref:OsmC family protein n=1 Tax=Nocardioides solisilvae TaxID=1542435 RepID=UPI000D7410F0|nr:OsmC family protein [Nocardioides solisilvae]
MGTHTYELSLRWTGNRGPGTSGYRDYGRDVEARSHAGEKPALLLSADKPFRGDPDRWNPEELLVAALSECHLLSFLHVAVTHGVTVTAYEDAPLGTMEQEGIGGRFTRVLLRPTVTVAEAAHVDLVPRLHHEAGQACFIAASVAFPVEHEPTTLVAGP